MTWAQFQTLVEEHLSVEASRRGLEAFRSRYMKNAVLDLQRNIVGYRQGNVTTYTASQVQTLTRASLGELPPQAKPKAFYIVCAQGDEALPPADQSITSWAELAELTTESRLLNSMISWVEADTGILKTVQLRTGTDATSTVDGIQRPNDYSDPDNLRVWYQVNA
jgi:hypothetical protein